MLQVHRGSDRRSEAILAPNFSVENGATGRKGKNARPVNFGFYDSCGNAGFFRQRQRSC
jgi:hypothetical protein